MNSSEINDKKLFQYFLTIFYVHYTSVMDVFEKGSYLKIRSNNIEQRLKSVFQVYPSDLQDIHSKARQDARLYKKSLIVRTKADSSLQNGISLVIKSTNHRLLEMEANAESLFEVKYKYDKENKLRLNVEVCQNSRVIQTAHIVEEDISGKIRYKKTIVCGPNQIHVYFEWVLDENSCARHLEDPLLTASSFSTVLLAIGSEYWTHFKIPFKLLAKHIDSRVRHIVYSSLHEMAFILDKTEKSNELLPLFRTYLEEVSVMDINYFYNCIVFFNDINHLERLEVLSSLRLLIKENCDSGGKLKTVLAKKLMTFLDDFDVKQIKDQLLSFVLDLLATNEDQRDCKILLKLFSNCANRLFPKDWSDINDNTIDDLVEQQIHFLNDTIKRLEIQDSTEDNLLSSACRQLVSDGILSGHNFNKIVEQIRHMTTK